MMDNNNNNKKRDNNNNETCYHGGRKLKTVTKALVQKRALKIHNNNKKEQ